MFLPDAARDARPRHRRPHLAQDRRVPPPGRGVPAARVRAASRGEDAGPRGRAAARRDRRRRSPPRSGPFPPGLAHRRATGALGHASRSTTGRAFEHVARAARKDQSPGAARTARARDRRRSCARSIPERSQHARDPDRRKRPPGSAGRDRPRTRGPRVGGRARRRLVARAGPLPASRSGRRMRSTRLQERVRFAGARVQTFVPGGTEGTPRSTRARRHPARDARQRHARRFRRRRASRGPVRERIVRIDGKLGALHAHGRDAGGLDARRGRAAKAAIPILPVPGSLRDRRPDGKSVAWIEVVGPSLLVPVITSLRSRRARARDRVSLRRPAAARPLARALSWRLSPDSRRTASGWDWRSRRGTTRPGPAPRYSVVSVATGELLFETSKDMKGFSRLLQ